MENILNVTSVKEIYGLTNGATSHYKPRNVITIPPFTVRSVVDTIASSCADKNTYF